MLWQCITVGRLAVVSMTWFWIPWIKSYYWWGVKSPTKLCKGNILRWRCTLKSFPWRTDFLITCLTSSWKYKIWEERNVPMLKSVAPDLEKLCSTETSSCGCLYGPKWMSSWSLDDFISSIVWWLGPGGGRCRTPWLEPQITSKHLWWVQNILECSSASNLISH